MPSIFRTRDKVFYGWVIVASVFTSSILMMGINSSFGVFFTSLESAFGLTRATTSAILSGRMVFCGIFAVLGGWALDRYGSRVVISVMGFFIGLSLILTAQTTAVWQMFITYSMLLAVGTGAAYIAIVATVSRWFDRRRGLALGIASSGSGLGLALVVPLSALLIDSFEWRNAFMIMGGIAWLVIISTSQLLKKDPYEIGTFPDGTIPAYQPSETKTNIIPEQRVSILQILRTRNFWVLLSIWLLMAFSGFFMMTHIIPHAVDLGSSSMESATILSISGIAMTVGRLTGGIITDKLNAKAVAIISSLLQAVVFLYLIWIQELWMLYFFGLIHGLTMGAFGTTITVIISRIFNLAGIGKVLGVLEIGIYIGGAIGPFLGGLIFDTSGSYSIAFLVMTAVILMRVIMVILIKEGKGEAQ
jgi:MFS family permease